MLKCPTKLHHLHKFRQDDKLYVADLDRFRIVEINQIAWDTLELSSTLKIEELIDHLNQTYPSKLVLETLKKLLGNFQNNDVIFCSPSWTGFPTPDKTRLSIYVPQGKNEWFLDPESISAGTNVALYHTTQSLSKFADIYLSAKTEEEIAPSIYTIRLSGNELKESPQRFNQRLKQIGISGILAHQNYGAYELFPFFREVALPIIVQNHAPRGHAGQAINTTLLHHSLMHPYDTFTSPSDSVAKLYSQFVSDTRRFHTNPNGVDAETFKPQDKSEAKRSSPAPCTKTVADRER